jgi:mRNA interferase RelE/StbE
VTTWPIAWTPSSKRCLSALPDKIALAALELIYGPLARDPHRIGKHLRFELQGLHVARRGDYRVIYEINEDAQCIIIHFVHHRRDAYRPR